MLRFKEFRNLLIEASEGDAYKYTKKVLEAFPEVLRNQLRADYGENWTRVIFNKVRDDFIHSGCDVLFTPGITRILYGELDYDSEDQDTMKVRQLRSIVKFITTAHKDQFTRNLARITVSTEGPTRGQKTISDPLTFDELNDMFSRSIAAASDAERSTFVADKNTPKYTVIWLKDFEIACQYLKYCTADPWCYLEHEDTFENYASTGNKLYLALAPGFEKLKPGDPGYGRSMIGFDMEPQDENGRSHLGVCNNRYNHAEDLEHENNKSGDNKYNEMELSKILGVPVWEAYPGYTSEELHALGFADMNDIVKTAVEMIKAAAAKSTIEEKLQSLVTGLHSLRKMQQFARTDIECVINNSSSSNVSWVFPIHDTKFKIEVKINSMKVCYMCYDFATNEFITPPILTNYEAEDPICAVANKLFDDYNNSHPVSIKVNDQKQCIGLYDLSTADNHLIEAPEGMIIQRTYASSSRVLEIVAVKPDKPDDEYCMLYSGGVLSELHHGPAQRLTKTKDSGGIFAIGNYQTEKTTILAEFDERYETAFKPLLTLPTHARLTTYHNLERAFDTNLPNTDSLIVYSISNEEDGSGEFNIFDCDAKKCLFKHNITLPNLAKHYPNIYSRVYNSDTGIFATVKVYEPKSETVDDVAVKRYIVNSNGDAVHSSRGELFADPIVQDKSYIIFDMR